MTRRLVSAALWAYFAWYLTAMLAAITGLPSAAGPVAGVMMLGFAAINWRAVAGSRTRAIRAPQAH